MAVRDFDPTQGAVWRSRASMDGVRRSAEKLFTSIPATPQFDARPIITPPMKRAKRQLDAVLAHERARRGITARLWHKVRGVLSHLLGWRFRRFLRRLQRALPDLDGITPRKALYISLVSGISFGMVVTSLAHTLMDSRVAATSSAPQMTTPPSPEALARELGVGNATYNPDDDIFLQFFNEAEKEEYSAQIRELVAGYPIEDMLPYILEKDRIVAAFLVGIAKKESNWGKRIPVLDGQDCYNYWGYRGIRRLMGSGGHTCFNSRKDAVDTVAARIQKLIHDNSLDTPAKMVIWKCGYSCSGHSRESVRKWIADVDLYFEKLQADPEEEGLVLNPTTIPE